VGDRLSSLKLVSPQLRAAEVAKKKPGVKQDNRMDWIILKILLTCPTFLCGLCVLCGESLPRLRPYLKLPKTPCPEREVVR